MMQATVYLFLYYTIMVFFVQADILHAVICLHL